MVVDTQRGNIIYYGTDDQQAQLAALLDELKTEDERVVIREYVLNHTDALTITDLLNGIITGEAQTGDSALLPGGSGRNNNRAFFNGFLSAAMPKAEAPFDPDKITVIADEFSNQVIIKHLSSAKRPGLLISRLDKQRSQVYIQAVIVSMATTKISRLHLRPRSWPASSRWAPTSGSHLRGRHSLIPSPSPPLLAASPLRSSAQNMSR